MDGSTNSEAAWNFAQKKLSQCIESHDCGKDQIHWYPTRLVDIGTETSDRAAVKLVETAKTKPEGPYVTLSHCWGDASLVTQLVQDNKAAFLAELPSLPPTLEDAIVATKRLGARYIWIDSLCIVQDDKGDWARESALMASVYRNALCNIAATAAEDSRGGLFHQRSQALAAIHVADELLMRYDSKQNEASDTERSPLQKVSLNPHRNAIFYTRSSNACECREVGCYRSACYRLGFSTSRAVNSCGSAGMSEHRKAFRTVSLRPGYVSSLRRFRCTKKLTEMISFSKSGPIS